MKKLITTVALFACSYWGMAQTPTLKWAKQFSSTTVAVGSSITSDASGNVYTVGRFGGTTDLDPGAGTSNVTASGSLTDIFISKVDANGAYVWGKSIGGNSSDAAFGVAVDGLGNVYVTGSFNGAVDFDPGAGITTLTSNGITDVFILKLDASGNFVWAKSVGGTGADEGLSIGVDGTGNVYAVGYYNSTVDFDPDAGTNNLTTPGTNSDAFTLKLNSSGNFQWVHRLNSAGPNQANSIAVTGAGVCYIAGSYQGAIAAGVFGCCAFSSSGSNDGYLLSLDALGGSHGGAIIPTSGDDAANAVTIDEGNNSVYFTGRYSGSVPGYSYTNAGGFDLFIQKLSIDAVTKLPSGPIGWGYGIGVGGNQEGVGIDVDPLNGNVFISGYIKGSAIDFDPSSNNTFLSATGASQDGFIAGYTKNGGFVSAFKIGNANFDIISAVDASNLNVHATGYFQGTQNFDPNGTFNLTSGNSGVAFDSYALKYSTCTPPVAPTIISSSGSQFVCSGNATTLIVSGTGNISWYSASTGGILLGTGANYTTPTLTTATTNTTVTYYAQDSTCTYSTRKAVTVFINSVPSVTANASSTSICLGNSLTLTGSGASTYAWSDGVTDGAPFSPTATTNYSVTGTSATGGCTNTANITVTVTSVGNPTTAFTYTPLVLTGFNEDVVANGNNFSTSTTADVDGSGTRFIDATFTQFGTPFPGRHLPTGGIINSITSPNPTFQLASYTANNSLRLASAGNTGTLTLATPTQMDMFYLLATSGSGNSFVDVEVFFTDNTSQIIPTVFIDDWFNASNAAIMGVGRVYSGVLDFNLPTSTNPRLYQYPITISPANASKIVSAVKFTSVNGAGNTKITHIMGITARVSVQEFCQSSNPTVANLIATGSNLQWYNSSNTLLTNTVSLINGDTYNVTQTIGGCPSQPASVVVSIKASPVLSANSATICNGSSVVLNVSGANTYTWSTGANTNTISVSPSSNTSYTVTGNGTSGCSGIAVSNILVNALPIVSVNNGTVCSGNSFTIIPTGANTYTISGGSSVVSPTSNISYSITGTSTDGCISSNTAISSVLVNGTPVITVPSATICAGATGTLSVNGAATYTWNTGSNANSIFASPVTTTTYTVNGTSIAGCLGSPVIATITVGSAPSISVNSATICAGSTTTLIANGLTTYTWSTGSNAASIVVTPTANVSYTVSGNLIGCSTSANNVSNVTVNALPVILANTNNSLLCVGQTASLTASGANSYVWNTTATTSVIAVNPTTTTIYTVTGIGANGCANVSTITQNVTVCTAIEQFTGVSNTPFVVYPNPTNDILNIALVSEPNEIAQMQIINVLGEIVINDTINSQHTLVNISHLSNGVYFLKVNENGVSKTIRVIKN